MRCVPRTGYLAHGKSNSEARGRSRHGNNSRRVVRDMEGRKVSAIKRKSPIQGLTSVKDLPIELPEGRESPYYRCP